MSERVRNVNSTDTSRTGAAEAGADPDDENRIDFGTLFPAKGDSRRPPEWFGRALLYVALAVIVFMFCWRCRSPHRCRPSSVRTPSAMS